jgi:hypothetical protein
MSAHPSPIPPAKATDDADVAWALSTAQTSFARGDEEEALKWLRRAAENASEAEDDLRALELAKAVAELAARIGSKRELGASQAPAGPPPAHAAGPASAAPPKPLQSVPPRPGPSAPPRPGASVPPRPSGAPARPSVAPRAAVSPARVEQPRPGGRPLAPKSLSKPPPKAEAGKPSKRKSMPDRSRKSFTEAEAMDRTDPTGTPIVERRPKARSIPPEDATRRDLTHFSSPHELEAMPTQAMSAEELAGLDEHARVTRVGPEPKEQLAAVPAMRARIVREADGSVRVLAAGEPRGTPVVILAVEGDVDLVALLGAR